MTCATLSDSIRGRAKNPARGTCRAPRRLLAGTFPLLLIFGCDRPEAPTAVDEPSAGPPLAPHFALLDGAHGAGNPHFFFLPPLVGDPETTGDFDASVAEHVTVEVCEWTADGCAEPAVAEFTTDGRGSESVRLDPDDEHYIVDWHTGRSRLDPETDYRLHVRVAGTELGHLDLDVVRTGRELKDVDTSEFVGVVDGRTVPIRFRIEEGAVYVVGSDGRTFTTPDGRVTLDIPEGALAEPVGITVLPADAAPADPAMVGGTAYELGPDGVAFAEPVTLTMHYDPASVPDGVDESHLLVHRAADDHWHEVDPRPDGGNADPDAHVVTGRILGFSTYGVLEQRPVESVALDPASVELAVDEEADLEAVLRDADGHRLLARVGREVAWASSDGDVASVAGDAVPITDGAEIVADPVPDGADPDGILVPPPPTRAAVSALEPGTATITASAQGRSDTADVDVGGGEVILRSFFHLPREVRYEPGSFGRRIDMPVRFGTGRTEFVGEDETVRVCGDDPRDVVLTLYLPDGTQDVEESRGDGEYDASTQRLVWDLGTLDAAAICERFAWPVIDVTVELSSAVPDGAMRTAEVEISTSSPSDDPSDNGDRAEFQVGFLPLEVVVSMTRFSCGGGLQDDPENCNYTVDDVTFPPQALARTSISPQWQPLPYEAGTLERGGEVSVEVRGRVSAVSGYNCTISSCEALDATADVETADARLQVHNVNPYPVRFHITSEAVLSASCVPAEVGGRSRAHARVEYGAFSSVTASCDGSTDLHENAGIRFVLDPAGGVCTIDVDDDGSSHEELPAFSSECTGPVARPSVRSGSVDFTRPRTIPFLDFTPGGIGRELRARARTDIVEGSGGTVEDIIRHNASASATSRITLRLPD